LFLQAAARAKLDKYQAHAYAARAASQVSELQSSAAAAQLQAGLIEMQRKVDEAEGRALQLQHVLTARLDELCTYLEHLGKWTAVVFLCPCMLPTPPPPETSAIPQMVLIIHMGALHLCMLHQLGYL
jgi:hypothetical protein